MKKLLTKRILGLVALALIVPMAFVMTACGSSSSSSWGRDANVVGTWITTYVAEYDFEVDCTDIYTFNADGTGSYVWLEEYNGTEYDSGEEQFTWRTKKGKIQMTYVYYAMEVGGETFTATMTSSYTIVGDVMTIQIPDEEEWQYMLEDDEEPMILTRVTE